MMIRRMRSVSVMKTRRKVVEKKKTKKKKKKEKKSLKSTAEDA